MRGIKFRAWDKERKELLNPGDAPWVDPKNCGNLIYCDMETIGIGLDGHLYLIDECGNWGYTPQVKKRFILMQYTGLKDKHNVEIYEGDIVELIQYKVIVEVFWNKDCGCWDLDENDNCKEDIYEDTLGDYIDSGIEVIGNIYENPELLKEDL